MKIKSYHKITFILFLNVNFISNDNATYQYISQYYSKHKKYTSLTILKNQGNLWGST